MIATVLSFAPGDIKKAGIKDPYGIHKAIYTLFPGSRRTFLYYDQGGDYRRRSILILSRQMPGIPEYGTIESKVVPTEFLQQEQYAFQIRVNPVRTDAATRKRTAITGKDALHTWFVEKSPEWGFHTSPDTLELTDAGVQTIKKGQRTLVHNVAEYRGVIAVTDREKFIQSFESGIGKAKAFGFGLLQIRPIFKSN